MTDQRSQTERVEICRSEPTASFAAKYRGECIGCLEAILPEQIIVWWKAEEASAHLVCRLHVIRRGETLEHPGLRRPHIKTEAGVE